jgi:hypothetical protein
MSKKTASRLDRFSQIKNKKSAFIWAAKNTIWAFLKGKPVDGASTMIQE